MKRFGVVALVCAAFASAGCTSTGSSSAANLGDTVYVDSGGGTPTPAAITRHDFDDVAKALAAKDTVGLAQLVGSGVVTLVPVCAPAKLLDTALGGERQVRVTSTGDAVWVDASWLKDKTSDCGA